MKKLTTLLVASCVLVGMGSANAQDGPPTWNPIEIYGCNYVDGADMSDLDGVIATWNAWMDDNGFNNYAAFVLSPHFTAASFPYEVLWFGVWPDGAALAGTQQWLAEGGPVQEDFAEVIACPLHQAMAMSNLKEIGEVAEGDIVPVEFTDCTVNEGRIGPEAGGALIEWTEILTQNGSDAGHWVLRPGPGEEPDADYSFKWLTAYPSWASAGRDFEFYFNGGGEQRLAQLASRVFSCDHPRMYNSRLVRNIADGD